MHLTKEDIEHVAWSRFNKKNTKYWYALLFGGMAALIATTLGLTYLFSDNQGPAVAGIVLTMALMVVGVIRYNKAQAKATKELIKQCEADPYLIYVPGTESLPAKEEATNPTK